jgi:glycosyltransferase involved in cell wall biosynthesis
MNCKICASSSTFFANAKLLNKYDVDYFKCTDCGFVQTEDPYWLAEAYSEAIAGSDIGLVTRNMNLSACTRLLLEQYFNSDGPFLDYGGGYGLFVRLMRDSGFNFYWSDKFCKNLFAQGFEDNGKSQYELVTAFELLEHLVDPVQEISEMLKLGNSLLFSTSLLPESNPVPGEWWYYAPHEGQHIAIYTHESLKRLSQHLGCNFYSDGQSVHLITKKNLPDDIFYTLGFVSSTSPRLSLLGQDAAKIFAPNQLESTITVDHSPEVITPDPQQPDYDKNCTIVVDAVFFQLYKTGIARLWKSLLEIWSKEDFRNNILVLDRDGTCPRIPGINYRSVQPFSYQDIDSDRSLLQTICEEEKADVFISTYYTTPIDTPTVFMGYDMIPEVFSWDFRHPMWVSKQISISQASSYITISDSTSRDLKKFYPQTSERQITTALCGVAPYFYPASQFELMQFRERFNLRKPYFLLVGPSMGYKNAELFLNGLKELVSRQGFDVVCTGSNAPIFSAEARSIIPNVVFHALNLDDGELRAAYSGAIALVYPSKYEGFGLPVLEAMKCNCPVITCSNSSLSEVGGNAVFYVDENDVAGLTDALLEVQKPSSRNRLIQLGTEQANKFNWKKMADQIKKCLIDQASLIKEANDLINKKILLLIDWNTDEEKVLDSIFRFLSIASEIDNLNTYDFWVDTADLPLQDVDTILSSGVMYYLMENDVPKIAEMKVRFVSLINLEGTEIDGFASKICLKSEINLPSTILNLPNFESVVK